jgi:heme exporter protein B
MVLFIFPLTFKSDPYLIHAVGPGIIWIAVLLTSLLSTERLFQHDYEQGVVAQWLVSGESLTVIVGAKVLAHWLFTFLPLLILSPIIAVAFSFTFAEWIVLMLSLLCATPALLFLCALASVFGGGVHQKGALMGLILLPLALPILILGSGIISTATQGVPMSATCCLLLACSVLAVGFLPLAIAGVLRISYVD